MTNKQIVENLTNKGFWDAAAHWLSLSDKERKQLLISLNKKE